MGLGILFGTPAALVVSAVGMIWPEGRKWALAGLIVSGLLVVWFGIQISSVFMR
ncbi:MAG: hypothetical protein NTW87_17960 [Planctomycetota bacterium]|nr:hypothetical protein [Planctomycetota bacterium]